MECESGKVSHCGQVASELGKFLQCGEGKCVGIVSLIWLHGSELWKVLQV